MCHAAAVAGSEEVEFITGYFQITSSKKGQIMQKSNLFYALALSGLLLTSAGVEAANVKKVTGLKTPESALVGKDGRIYVSEVNGFDKDGDGQISVIGTNGKLKVFATGMDDPKGLAMIGDDVYVADKTRVLKVTPDGKWQVFAAADAFPETPQFLNDMVADGLGNLYVSDSGDISGKTDKAGAIYRINKNGKVATVVDASNPLVKGPNGLLMGGRGTLLEVDFKSGILYSVQLGNGEMKQLAEGFGGGDGLVRGNNGMLYVSDWKSGKVYSVNKQGNVKLIKEGFQSAADIALSANGKSLMVPDMKAGELVWLPLH
jgi:gluconolactonase